MRVLRGECPIAAATGGGGGTPIGGGGAGSPPPSAPSVLSRLAVRPARFRVSGPKRGTTISFRLTRASAVTLAFERMTAGHRKGKHSVAHARKGRRCSIIKRVGRLDDRARSRRRRQRPVHRQVARQGGRARSLPAGRDAGARPLADREVHGSARAAPWPPLSTNRRTPWDMEHCVVRRGHVLRRRASACSLARCRRAGVAPRAGRRRATPTFSADGSAKQVYVTGLAPARADVARSTPAGQTLADPEGRLARRAAVPERAAGHAATACAASPTARSRGRSRCTPTQAAPWNPGDLQPVDSRQRLHVPHHPRRDEARHRRAPADEPGRRARPPAGHAASERPRLHAAVPDADRVLGLRLRQPGRARQRHRRAREPDGLRGRRREHARHRLLGRRLRLLRAAAEPRRLRRDRDDRPPAVGARPQGRDDGHLLRRRSASCSPPSSTRRASRRSRRCRRSTPRRRRSTRAASSTPASPSPGRSSASRRPSPPGPNSGQPWAYQQIQSGDTTCAANQVLHGEAADLSAKIARQLALRRRRSPTRSTRSPSSTRSTCRCSWPASGRTSRPADTAPSWSGTSPARRRSGSPSPTARTSTRSTPTRTTAGTTSCELFVAHQAPIAERRRSPGPPRRSSTRRRWASRRPTWSRCRPTRSSRSRRTTPRSPRSSSCRRSGCCSTTAPAQSPTGPSNAGRPLSRASSRLLVASRSRAPPRAPGTSGRPARSATQPPTSAGINSLHVRTRSALPLTDFGEQHRDRRAVGQRVAVAVELAAEPVRHRGLLRLGAARRRTPRSIGGGAVHLWVRSSTPDVDLQATISEVRPDGNETFVQNGWLRASERKLSTELEQHVQAAEHRARADPDVHGGRRAADAGRPVRQGRRPALLRGPRVPRRARASG